MDRTMCFLGWVRNGVTRLVPKGCGCKNYKEAGG